MRLPDTRSSFPLQRAVFHREPRPPSSIPVWPQLSSSSEDVKSESEWQLPCSADAKKKGRPIKSPDIKSPRREFTAWRVKASLNHGRVLFTPPRTYSKLLNHEY